MGRRKGGKGVVLVETKTGRRPLIESHICSGPVRALSPTLLPSSSTSLPSPFFPLLFSGARAFSSVFSYRLVGYETGGGRKKLVDAYRNRGLELKYSGNIRFGNTRRRRRRGRSMSNDKKNIFYIFANTRYHYFPFRLILGKSERKFGKWKNSPILSHWRQHIY